MKTVAKAAANTTNEIDQQWFIHAVLDGWDKSCEFYEVQKTKTSGEGRLAVVGSGRDNGWEAWGRLVQQLEPISGIRRGQVPSELGNFNTKRCKKGQGTSPTTDVDRPF